MRGPVPKKDAERRRRNKSPEKEGSFSHVPAEVVVLDSMEDLEALTGYTSPVMDSSWHPVAKQIWEAQKVSGQSQWMEPSDWALLYLTCESISRDLNPQFVGMTEEGEVVKDVIPLKGASLSAYSRLFSQLMMTEGDRRRVRVELERDRRADEMAKAKVVDIVKSRAELFS